VSVFDSFSDKALQLLNDLVRNNSFSFELESTTAANNSSNLTNVVKEETKSPVDIFQTQSSMSAQQNNVTTLPMSVNTNTTSYYKQGLFTSRHRKIDTHKNCSGSSVDMRGKTLVEILMKALFSSNRRMHGMSSSSSSSSSESSSLENNKTMLGVNERNSNGTHVKTGDSKKQKKHKKNKEKNSRSIFFLII
jgi:hypothetical protein